MTTDGDPFQESKAFTKSFAVGSEFGPRSYKWVITVDKGEVYCTNSVGRHTWKVSLHRSGRWHIKQIGKNPGPPLLKVHEYDADPAIVNTGFLIVIPDASLRPASDPDVASEVDTWLDRPQYDGFVEVAIGRFRPGQFSHGLQRLEEHLFEVHLARLADDSAVYMANRACPPDSLAAQTYQQWLDQARAQFPAPVTLDSPERRAIVFANSNRGAIMALELAID